MTELSLEELHRQNDALWDALEAIHDEAAKCGNTPLALFVRQKCYELVAQPLKTPNADVTGLAPKGDKS